MDFKVGKGIFKFFLLVFFLLISSCKKKYDYGHVESINARTGNSLEEKTNIPSLGEKIQLAADWLLDEDGLEKIKIRIENYPESFVELDLSNCEIPSGKFGDLTLPDGAFEGIENLGSVILPKQMTTIPAGLFKGCVNLQTVTFPLRLTSIEGHAFEGCLNLRDIYTSGDALYIFSYNGDGLAHPDIDKYLKSVKIHYDENVVDYTNWYQFCWEYTKRLEPKKVSFTEIWASSFQEGYEAAKLADETWGTWFENSEGEGEGQEIVMHFTRKNSVSTLTFKNGNGNTKNFWNNNRVKDLDIYFGNDPAAVRITLKDSCEKQTFKFLYGHRKMIQYDKIRMVIRSVYPGGNGKETCLAEVSVNDEDMANYMEDSYTKSMIDSLPFEKDGSTAYKIWRVKNSYPVMLAFKKQTDGEDILTDFPICMVYDGTGWTDAQNSVWQSIATAFKTGEKINKRALCSFGETEFDFSIQFMRSVFMHKDAVYGSPYLFDFDGTRFVLKTEADFSMKKISVDVEDFFSTVENLKKDGIYRLDLKGELTLDFFKRMQNLLSDEKDVSINRNYILNMWDCFFSPDLQDTLFADSICGYFIQLVLPKSTKRILKSAVAVASDIISIPPNVKKIEAGAFVSSSGNLYDLYPNNLAFENESISQGYTIDGRLLLESIPDSGGEKRVLLYCGNASEFLGTEDSSTRSLTLPDSVTEIASYAFYNADLDSIKFPEKFYLAQEKCFDKTKIKHIDLSAVNEEDFSMTTVRQLGQLISSNPGITVDGDFYCICAAGKMTDSLIEKIENEMKVRSDKKVYLDLSASSLIWSDQEKKFIPLPEMFLYDCQNLYWITLGHYNYIPQNTCRDCHQLRYVQFTQVPEKIAEPAFKGCHASACAVENGNLFPLWEYAQKKKF